MKKRFYLAGIVLLALASCTDKADFMYQDRSDELQANVESYLSTRTVQVEVPEGKMAIVRDGEEVIATLTETSYLIVPKGETAQAQSRATITLPDTPVTVEYIDNSGQRGQGFNEVDGNTTSESFKYPFEENSNCLKQTVAFEDDINGGDHDYNDLIINATILIPTQGGKLKMLINPLALGSTFSFNLGFRYNGADHWITETDCRTDLFKGEGGYLNTLKDKPLKKYPIVKKEFDVTEMTESSAIDWFIEVDGKRLYAVNRFNKEWIDNHMLPYGFALTYVFGPHVPVNTSAFLVRESDYTHLKFNWKIADRDKNGDICLNEKTNRYHITQGYGPVHVKPNSWWNWPAENVSIDKVYSNFTKVFTDKAYTTNSYPYSSLTDDRIIDKLLSSAGSYTNKAIRKNAINAIGSTRTNYYSTSNYKEYQETGIKNSYVLVLEEIEKGLYFREELTPYLYSMTGLGGNIAKNAETYFRGFTIPEGMSYEILDKNNRKLMKNVTYWSKHYISGQGNVEPIDLPDEVKEQQNWN